MPRQGVGDLMARARGWSRLIFRDVEDPRIDSDLSAWQREGVYGLVVFDDAHFPRKGVGNVCVLGFLGCLNDSRRPSLDRFDFTWILGGRHLRIVENLLIGLGALLHFLGGRHHYELVTTSVRIG